MTLTLTKKMSAENNLRRFVIQTINNGTVSRRLAPQHQQIVNELMNRARERHYQRQVIRHLLTVGLLRTNVNRTALEEGTNKPHKSRIFEFTSEGTFDDCCSICFEPMLQGQLLVRLQCSETVNHIYHNDCIKPWFETKANCPTCRSDLSKPINSDNTA